MEIIHLNEVNSTNVYALDLVRAGKIDAPTVVYADVQTAGIGSRGRNWESRIGNVAASYILPLRGLDRPTQWLVHCCALATRKTLTDIGVTDRINLKWPNDILIEDRKVSGSLHASSYHGAESFLVAGIGINVVWHPDPKTALFPPTSISKHIRDVPSHHVITKKLFECIMDLLSEYKKNGYSSIKNAYLKYMWRRNEQVGISLEKEKNIKFEGINRGVADDGSLMLETGGEIKHIMVGDIFSLN